MVIYRLLFALFVSFFTNVIRPTTVSIEELYNPELKQTAILAGDFHIVSDQDQIQQNAILDLVKKYKGYCSVEGSGNIDSNMLLDNILKAGNKAKIGVQNAECRQAYINCMRLVLSSWQEYGTYAAIKAQWQSDTLKKPVYNTFNICLDEAYLCIEKMKEFVASLPKENTYDKQHALFFDNTIKHMNDLFTQIVQELPQAEENKEEEINSWAVFLAENIFIDNAHNYADLNTNSIYHKLEKINEHYFEANMMREVYNNRDKRLIVIATGYIHANNMRNVLKNCNYEIKHSVALSQNLEKDYTRIFNEKGAQAAFYSPELGKYAVNVDEFIKKAQSLL